MSRRNKKNIEAQVQPQPVIKKSSRVKKILLVCIALVTFGCYNYTLQNRFTDWDDDIYVENNHFIKNLTPDNWNMILFHNITDNYYHPITMLTIAANYQISKMEPFGYYFTNVSIHVIDTCIMFLLVLMLLEAMEEKGYEAIKHKEWLAALGALLFGIHPMHVESVAWISERKDVLYALFYFLGMMAYIKYLKEEKMKWMVYVVILFIGSLLSKPLAVVFPLSLIALDVLLKRKFNAKSILEKIPMLLISVGAGIWAYQGQVSSGSTNSFPNITLMERFIPASYGYVMYIVKAFVPINLCSFYPYPVSDLNPSVTLPFIFYIMPYIGIIGTALAIFAAYRAGENYFRVVLFGFGFYFINIVFVSQFIPSGPNIIAERYTYISYLGIFFIVIYLIHRLWEKVQASHVLLEIGLICSLLTLGYVCYSRTKVWHSTETLWTDVVNKYPNRIECAYNSLGSYYFLNGNMDDAFANYKKSIGMHTGDPKAYCNIGNIYAMRNQLGEALKSYAEALKLDSTDFNTYLDRGVTYSSVGKFDSAEMDYNHAFRADTTSEKLLRARAYNYLNVGKYDKAVADYRRLIALNPDMPFYFQKMAVAETYLGDTNKAFADFNHCLTLQPNNGGCIFDVSVAYRRFKNYHRALEFANRAKQVGYKLPDSYISSLQQIVNSSGK
jgi:tetratricopeptide (TPR) repeat protein